MSQAYGHHHIVQCFSSLHCSADQELGGGGRLLCITRDASCAYGLLCVPPMHLIIVVHSTSIAGCTFVTRDTTRCILGSESQRIGWDVGLAWITSGGILVGCHGIWGGGVAPEVSATASNRSYMASSKHHLSMHCSPHGNQHASIPSGCGLSQG